MFKAGLKFFGAVALASGFAVCGLAPTVLLAGASAQSTGNVPASVARLTVRELAGTWVEPVTVSDDGDVITRGSENIVEITSDGRFNDALEIQFTFRSIPDFDGLYRFTSEGRIFIASGKITWAVEGAEVVPVFPSNASAEKRAAMNYLAAELGKGMLEAETYPMLSYDGNQLVMNAGGADDIDEYVMTRR